MALTPPRDQGLRTIEGSRIALGYEQITGLNTVKGLTPPDGATLVVLNVETKSIRWRDDGTSPTASVGMELFASDTFIYNGELTRIRFIEEAASAKINVSYYR